MKKDLSDYRKSYKKSQLNKSDMNPDPFAMFDLWFKEIENQADYIEANAMTLSTMGSDGFPKGRIVLLKEYDENGFIFYTNYSSEKGQGIANHNSVCLSFFWPQLERQIIIKGRASKVSEEKSKQYFASRPKGSQLGAMVSNQSGAIKERAILEKRLAELESQYHNKEVPKPKDWGGYQVEPMEFEFWQGRENRLHDRFRYLKDKDSWQLDRLQP